MIFLAGIPWLAGAIGALFGTVFSFLAKYLTKRLAFVLASIVALTGTTLSVFTAVQAVMTGISVTFPAGLVQSAAMFGPGNLGECISAWFTVKVLCWAYDWNVRIIQYKMF